MNRFYIYMPSSYRIPTGFDLDYRSSVTLSQKNFYYFLETLLMPAFQALFSHRITRFIHKWGNPYGKRVSGFTLIRVTEERYSGMARPLRVRSLTSKPARNFRVKQFSVDDEAQNEAAAELDKL